VPDDRLGDLGRGGERPPEGRQGAAERLAELDAGERPPEREPPPRPSSRYSWVVGIAFLIAIAVAGANAIRHSGGSLKGISRGEELPVFAAPLATGGLDKDANVKQRAKDPGERFACSVRGHGILNICDLRRKPVVLAFMFTRAANCAPQFDRIERIRRQFPQVAFVGVIVRESREDAAKLYRQHGWHFPVAFDRDGAVSNVYAIGGCPTTTFARAGGRVVTTKLGNLSERELRAQIRRIL
jgi:peroxiredoxin